MAQVEAFEARELQELSLLTTDEQAEVRVWAEAARREKAARRIIHLGNVPETSLRVSFNDGVFFRPGLYNAMDNKRASGALALERDRHIRETTEAHVVCGHIFGVLGVPYDEPMQRYLANEFAAYTELFGVAGNVTVESQNGSTFNQAISALQDHMFEGSGIIFETKVGEAQHFGNWVLAQAQLTTEDLSSQG